jgi:protein SCO1/2
MNESVSVRPFAIIALFFAVLLGACGQAAAPAGDPPLKGSTMGGPFTLTDQNGRRVSDRDFAGKYRLIYFGYTYCPDVCPVDMRVIGAGLRQFEGSDPARAAKVVPIFITVDPARDTPPVLRQFVANFHPRMVGLTGSEDEIARVAREYGITYARGDGTGAGYLMNHTRYAILYGPAGEPLAIVPHDLGPGGVATELAKWVS